MKIIIPMAGLGTRMRPHTLTVNKPLIPVAGKSIVQRLVEGISKVLNKEIQEIAFVIGRFGEKVENELKNIAESVGAKGSIYYQDVAMGTGHAVWCASESLKGQVVVAFADTLFYTKFDLPENADGAIWVKEVENPEAFGVVTTNEAGIINGFVEKPKTPVSNLAIIGIYYFKDGENLQKELQRLIDENIRGNNEYQLTDALENMRKAGLKFVPGKVNEWLDCGNKDATVFTNQRVLENEPQNISDRKKLKLINSVIVEPCFIGNSVTIENSVVGPWVSVGNNTKIKSSIISNSILQNNSTLENLVLTNSMIGNYVEMKAKPKDLSVGDYNIIHE
ncbi:MAG: nucleotidyltransferase [Bacteroidales bacterium]|nr:nucleotidyltransferase [Bacteroidales bacterium]